MGGGNIYPLGRGVGFVKMEARFRAGFSVHIIWGFQVNGKKNLASKVLHVSPQVPCMLNMIYPSFFVRLFIVCYARGGERSSSSVFQLANQLRRGITKRRNFFLYITFFFRSGKRIKISFAPSSPTTSYSF